jgi:UDP-2,3-diacylglucosamine pyrophosphatase LpxH
MKNLIEKLIHRLLKGCRRSEKRYFFARLLAELIKDENKTNNVAILLANYFLEYNHGEKFQFNDIFVVGDIIYIYTLRPGYWIGKGGSVADDILNKLNFNREGQRMGNFELRFIEQLKSTPSSITRYMLVINSNY